MGGMYPCTFAISSCFEEGEYREDLEGFYCLRHAEAVRSLIEEPPLARLTQVGTEALSPAGLITLADVETAIDLIREEHLDAVGIRWPGHIMWLRKGHRFLKLCREELKVLAGT